MAANPWDDIFARDLGETEPDTDALVSGQTPDEQPLSREINPWDDIIARDLEDYDAQVEGIEPQPESEPGYFGNLGRGIAERGADLLGNLAGFAQTTGQHVEDAAGVLDWVPQMGGIVHKGDWDFDYLNAEEWQQYNQQGGPLLLRDFQREWEGADFGFTSNAEQNWENLKNNPNILRKAQSLAAFGLEVGAISLADMAAAVAVPSLYWASRSEEIAQDRAASNGRPGNPSPSDMAVGASTAAVITAMERFGAEQIFSAFLKGGSTLRKILRAGVGEAGTEFFQEQLEYGAETLGTEAGKDLTPEEYTMASLERGAQGAVGGGTAGTVLGVPGALLSRDDQVEPEADNVQSLEFNKDAIDKALFEEANQDLIRAADQAREQQNQDELEQLKTTRGWIDLQEKPFKTPVHAETELFQYELENGPAGFRIVQDPRDGQWYVRTFEDAQLLEALAATEVQEGEVITPGQPAPTTEGIEVGEEIDIEAPGPTTEGIEVEEVGEQIEMKRGPIYEKGREAKETPTEEEWEGVSREDAEAQVRGETYPTPTHAAAAAQPVNKKYGTNLTPYPTDDGWKVGPPGLARIWEQRKQQQETKGDLDQIPTRAEIEVTEAEEIELEGGVVEVEEFEVPPTTGVGVIPEGIEVEELEAEEITLGRKIYQDRPPKPPDDEGPPPPPGGAPPGGAPPPGGGAPQVEITDVPEGEEGADVVAMGGVAAPLGAASETDLDDMSDAQIATRVEQIDARLDEFPRQIDSTQPDAVDLMDEYHRLMTEKRNMQDMTQLGWDMENVNRIRAETWEENHKYNAGGKKYDTVLELEDKIEAAKGAQQVEREAQLEAEEAETATSEATGQEIPISYLDEDEYRGFVDTAEARGDVLILNIGQVEVAGQYIVRKRREGDEEIEAKTAAAKPSMSKAAAAAKEQAETDDGGGYAVEKIPPTEVMETAFRVLGRGKVLDAISAEIEDGNWGQWEPGTPVIRRVSERISLNMLSKSDKSKWPQPNKHGVYKNEDAEKINFPARKTHQYLAYLHVLEAYENMWITGDTTHFKDSAQGSGISSGSGIYVSRDEAVNAILRSWQKRAKDTEHRGHKAFKQWVDEKILETRPDRKPAHVSQPEWDARNDPELLKELKRISRAMGGWTMEQLSAHAARNNYPRSGPYGNVRDNRGAIIEEAQRRFVATQEDSTETETEAGAEPPAKWIGDGTNILEGPVQVRNSVLRFEDGGQTSKKRVMERLEEEYGLPEGMAADPRKFTSYDLARAYNERVWEAQQQEATAEVEGPYQPEPDWPWAVLGHPTEDDKAGVLWAFGDTREEAENDFRENLTEKDQKVIDAEKDIVYVQIPPEIDYDHYDGRARDFYADYYAGELKLEGPAEPTRTEQIERIVAGETEEHPRVPGRMDTETLEDGTVYDLSKSAETQIATTTPTYDKVKDQYFPAVAARDILDYGAGKGLASQKHGFESLEPYPRGWSPDYQSTYDIKRQYDGVIMNNILNVLPKHSRRAVLWDAAEKTRPGGQIFVNVRSRGDVIKTKHQKVINKRNAEILTSRGTYQKGFTFGELVTFIGQELGPDYTVAKADPGSVAVIITKSKKLPPMWDGGGVREEAEQGYLPGMEPTQTEKTDYEAQHKADLFVESNPHFRGLRLSHKPGDERNGITQTHYYGEILNTEDADGMPADVILNADHDPSVVSPIYIVNVVDPKTGEFEQHKTMAGFRDILDAEDGFIEQFNGDDRFGDVHLISPEMYREWLNNPEQLKKEFNPWTFRGEINKGKDLGKPVPGDNIMTAKFLAEKGDIVNFSPWLLADGSVVETGSDHVGYALERGISDDPTMDREVAVVSLFQQLGGAVRTAFFHDSIDDLNIAWLHMHTDQTLTPAQISMLGDFFRESRKLKIKPAVLIGTSGDGNNPQTVQIDSIAELKRMQTGVSEPKPAYGASDPNERLNQAGREDLAWEPAPEPPAMPTEEGPPPPVPERGEPTGEPWQPVPTPERPPEVDVDGVLEASIGDTDLSNIPLTATEGDTRITHNAKWWVKAVDQRLINLNKLRGCGR